MIYKLDLELNEFKTKQIKKRAQVQAISEDDVLIDLFDKFVGDELERLIVQDLNDKIDNLTPGRALAMINAMDVE